MHRNPTKNHFWEPMRALGKVGAAGGRVGRPVGPVGTGRRPVRNGRQQPPPPPLGARSSHIRGLQMTSRSRGRGFSFLPTKAIDGINAGG